MSQALFPCQPWFPTAKQRTIWLVEGGKLAPELAAKSRRSRKEQTSFRARRGKTFFGMLLLRVFALQSELKSSRSWWPMRNSFARCGSTTRRTGQRGRNGRGPRRTKPEPAPISDFKFQMPPSGRLHGRTFVAPAEFQEKTIPPMALLVGSLHAAGPNPNRAICTRTALESALLSVSRSGSIIPPRRASSTPAGAPPVVYPLSMEFRHFSRSSPRIQNGPHDPSAMLSVG
jgi:hypothetical protein